MHAACVNEWNHLSVIRSQFQSNDAFQHKLIRPPLLQLGEVYDVALALSGVPPLPGAVAAEGGGVGRAALALLSCLPTARALSEGVVAVLESRNAEAGVFAL